MTAAKTPSTDPDVQLVLRGLPSDVPLAVRLRRALKALLRSYDLRCLSIRNVPAQPPTQAAAAFTDDDDDAA